MLGVILAAALIVAGSLVVGQLVARLCGFVAWTWASAPLGFALLMVVSAPAEFLPGGAVITLVAIVLLVAAGVRQLVRHPDHRPPALDIALVLPTAAMLTLPFLANGRVGVPGVGFNTDTAFHLSWSDAIARTVGYVPVDYPMGPHALMAAFLEVGYPGDLVITGLIVAIPLLSAFAALALVDRGPLLVRAGAALFAALPYLGASYVAEGAFKETTMVLLLLGLAACLQESWGRNDERRFLPVAIIAAGIVSVYSFLGLAWFVMACGILSLWWVAQTLHGEGVRGLLAGVGRRVFPVTVSVLLAIGLLVPQLPRIQAFFDWNQASGGIPVDSLGNLAGPISRNELWGIWFTPDFRFASPHGTILTLGAVVVAVLLVGAIAWMLRRSSPALPAVALAAFVAALAAGHTQSPYVAAKSLVLVSPFVAVLIGRAIGAGAVSLPRPPRAGLYVAAAGAAALALWSSGLALRGAQVGDRTHARDLRAVAALLRPAAPTLYLGLDDYAAWELREVPVTQPWLGAPSFPPNPAKPWSYGQGFDIDHVPAAQLDGFGYVVAPAVRSTSEMPENLQRIGRRGAFEVYRRVGPTVPREILDEGGYGAAKLDCATASGRRIARLGGVARVRGPHVVGTLGPIGAHATGSVGIVLTPGVWDLDLRYTSARAITIRAPGFRATVPPALERVGSIWPAGSIRVTKTGVVPFTFTPQYRPLGVDGATAILPSEIIAQRRGGDATIPLAEACGREVDWYRPSAAPTRTGRTG